MEDRYHLIIRRSEHNKNGEAGEILVDAYDISLVCAYNIIKLYGNCVELKRIDDEDCNCVDLRLEGKDGETV